MGTLYAPNGDVIVGTSERILAVSHINAYRDENGDITYDHTGNSTVFWDTSETQLSPDHDTFGEPLFTDESGNDWPLSKLELREDDE